MHLASKKNQNSNSSHSFWPANPSKGHVFGTMLSIDLQVSKQAANYQSGKHRSMRQKQREQKVTLMVIMTVMVTISSPPSECGMCFPRG